MPGALRILSALFDVDTAKATTSLQSLDKGISTAKASLAGMATALIGAFSVRAFAGFISQQIDVGDALDKTSKKLGVSTDELQKFQYAADLSGVSAEQAATALGLLNKNMGEALGGGAEQVKTFAELGVQLKDAHGNVRALGDVVPELADGFTKMGSQQERTAAAMKLFGRSGASLLPLLTQGSGAINELNQQFEELGLGIDQDFIQKSADAKDALSRLHRGFGALKTKIAIEMLPTITEWSGKISKGIAWVIKLTKETHIVKEVLAVAGVAGAAAGLKMALSWAKFFGVFPKGNASIVKTLASMGYIGIIIGLVAVLALIFEDLWVGIKGGQSVIRNWLNETLGVENTNELFDNLSTIVDQISDAFKNMSPSVASLVKMLASIVVSPYFVATIEFIVRLLGSMVALLVAAARAAGNIVTGDFAGAGKAVDQGGDAVFGKNGFFGENAFKPYAPRTPAAPVPAGQGPPVAVTQDNKTTINVNGAGDPEVVGRRVVAFQRGAANENAAALAALTTGAGE